APLCWRCDRGLMRAGTAIARPASTPCRFSSQLARRWSETAGRTPEPRYEAKTTFRRGPHRDLAWWDDWPLASHRMDSLLRDFIVLGNQGPDLVDRQLGLGLPGMLRSGHLQLRIWALCSRRRSSCRTRLRS